MAMLQDELEHDGPETFSLVVGMNGEDLQHWLW